MGTECSVTKPFQISMWYNCNKFFVFDYGVLVLACLTSNSLKYRGAHACIHLKVIIISLVVVGGGGRVEVLVAALVLLLVLKQVIGFDFLKH